MKKRYTTTCSNYTIHLEVRGERIIKEFTGKDVLLKLRYIDTEDTDLQKALEATPSFGVHFIKSTEFDWMEVEEAARVPMEVKTFATNALAKAWINENHGVPYHKISNKEELTKEYAALGFELQFAKS